MQRTRTVPNTTLDRASRSARPSERQRSTQRRKLALILGALLSVAALLPTHAWSRDLQGRLGLGYNAEFANFQTIGGVPGISLKYGFTRDLAIELVGGVSTASPTNSVAAVKFFKNIFYETNLNFYATLGGGFVSGGGFSGMELLGGFGAEAFIPGIESLGFSMELGGSFNNLSGSYGLKTLGVSFLNAGIHFYF